MTPDYLSDFTLYGRLVLAGRIIDDGAVSVENGIIKYSGGAAGAPAIGEVIRTDNIIASGFVDIHCHAGGEYYAYEDPQYVADYHLSHGTTGMLLTFYRDLGHENTVRYINAVKKIMLAGSNVLGVHLEGPYLNPSYGAAAGYETPVCPEKYRELAATGVVRQWTFAPEVDGTAEFLRYIVSLGIVPAIGHSAASPEQVYAANAGGARIVTHLYDATGTSVSPTRWGGTIETSFCSAALLCDDMYYEIICDSAGIHVRPDMVRLTAKTVGCGRIIGITDACTGSIDDSDVNFVGSDLMGSKLTMDAVARNFLALGFSIPEVFAITSENPATAIRMSDKVGSLREGRRGDVLIVDDKLNLVRIIKSGAN